MEEVKDTKIELTKEQLNPVGATSFYEQNTIKDAEWCFQFFDTEPVVFAWNEDSSIEPRPLVMEFKPIEGQGVTFQKNGMVFRIFPREITEPTKIQREKDKNESKN